MGVVVAVARNGFLGEVLGGTVEGKNGVVQSDASVQPGGAISFAEFHQGFIRFLRFFADIHRGL